MAWTSEDFNFNISPDCHQFELGTKGDLVLGFILIILASFSWALDTLIRYPLLGSGVSALRIVLTEHLFLVLIFLPFFLRKKENFTQFRMSHLIGFTVIGVFGSAIATLTFTEAFRLINPSLVIILQKLQPFVAAFFARGLLGEKPSKYYWPLMLTTLLGVFLVSAPELLGGLNQVEFNFDTLKLIFHRDSALGLLLTLVAVVSWGASTAFGKKLSRDGLSENAIMSGRFFFGFVFLLFYAWGNDEFAQFDLNFTVWRNILGMVLLSGLLGMYLYYRGLREISARSAALAELFFPLASVGINWVVLNKPLTPMQMAGALLMLFSSTIVQWKKF